MQHVPEPDRVRANTWPAVNERLDREAELRVRDYSHQDAASIGRRIDELDREWDFERVLQTEAASMGILGLSLVLAVSSRFLILPGMVGAMLLLHGTQGWYPLLPLFRRLSVRSREEIHRERYALKAVRGDFESLASTEQNRRAEAAWRAVMA